MSQIHVKPHEDAILVRISTGETRPYPTGRPRDVAQDVADAKLEGYCVAVPIVKTASGKQMYVSIEAQVGGVAGLDKVLRSQRRVGKGEQTTYVVANVLASEWARMPAADRDALAEKKERRTDPRDAEIAALKAELARMSAAQAPAPQKGGRS